MITERPMSTARVAEVLGVSRSTILGLARREDNPLPSIKIGAHYRFFWSDVATFFNIPADKQESAQAPEKAIPEVSEDFNDDYDQEI